MNSLPASRGVVGLKGGAWVWGLGKGYRHIHAVGAGRACVYWSGIVKSKSGTRLDEFMELTLAIVGLCPKQMSSLPVKSPRYGTLNDV